MLFSRVKETHPQDAPAIAPDVVPTVSSTWADKVLADITRDARTIQPDIRPGREAPAPSMAVVSAPSVDTTFRATAVAYKPPSPVETPPLPNSTSKSTWLRKVSFIFMFALVSACATGLWKHYGGPARQTIAEWTPLISEFIPQFSLASSQPDAAAPANQHTAEEQAAAPVEQTAASDQTISTSDAAPAGAAAAPGIAAGLPTDAAELMQSMQRDLSALGQQVEQLKATIAELKAGQAPSPVVARTTEARPSEARASEVKPPAPAARPRVTAVQPPPPPRSAAPPPVRRPPPVQASAAPMQLAAPPPPAPPPPQQADDGGPVVRPPMSLRWNGVSD